MLTINIISCIILLRISYISSALYSDFHAITGINFRIILKIIVKTIQLSQNDTLLQNMNIPLITVIMQITNLIMC